MARLDRLGPAAKEVAQIGAAFGRDFSYQPLAVVAPKGDELDESLDRLVDAALIFGHGAGIVTRVSVRPWICVPSLLLAVLPAAAASAFEATPEHFVLRPWRR